MAKSGLIKAMDDLPWIVKLILCIPALDIVWAIYRIVKGVTESKPIVLLFGILWIFPGVVFAWLIDLVSTILFGRPRLFA